MPICSGGFRWLKNRCAFKDCRRERAGWNSRSWANSCPRSMIQSHEIEFQAPVVIAENDAPCACEDSQLRATDEFGFAARPRIGHFRRQSLHSGPVPLSAPC